MKQPKPRFVPQKEVKKILLKIMTEQGDQKDDANRMLDNMNINDMGKYLLNLE